MRVIRPVEHADIAALMQLAGKTGGGLTSLPANEATLAARIERALKTWSGEQPKSEQGYVFVLEDSETGEVGGICAIEVAVGLNDPWYNYRVGTLVHASKELNVYNALPTLFLSNDHTGSSELCTLFLDPEWRKEGNGYLLSKSRFMFMAAFRDKFNEKVVAEMRGVIDEHGYSPFWQSLGKRFFSMDFSRADFLCGTGQKAFIAELMPKHPIYTHFLSEEAQAVIGEVHPQTAPARAVLEKEGFRYRHYIDIFDGGRRWSVILTAYGPFVKADWWKSWKGNPRLATIRHVWLPMKTITTFGPHWCAPIRRLHNLYLPPRSWMR
ncbi:arginine succinyltransferase [Salmonella enterica subsp. diarizonae]|uniref:Arginine N-succinyltransferase n=1 Tax=Salmonella diarizonae TaxID=59204 RepID=A0A379TXQ6_SALDZ|nr:arginine succinyltransferase [Salmonella enterica subsp. diarizonae]